MIRLFKHYIPNTGLLLELRMLLGKTLGGRVFTR